MTGLNDCIESWGFIPVDGGRAKPETDRLRREREISVNAPEISRREMSLALCVQRQAAAVRMFHRRAAINV